MAGETGDAMPDHGTAHRATKLPVSMHAATRPIVTRTARQMVTDQTLIVRIAPPRHAARPALPTGHQNADMIVSRIGAQIEARTTARATTVARTVATRTKARPPASPTTSRPSCANPP
jgi:hypothetical protein